MTQLEQRQHSPCCQSNLAPESIFRKYCTSVPSGANVEYCVFLTALLPITGAARKQRETVQACNGARDLPVAWRRLKSDVGTVLQFSLFGGPHSYQKHTCCNGASSKCRLTKCSQNRLGANSGCRRKSMSASSRARSYHPIHVLHESERCCKFGTLCFTNCSVVKHGCGKEAR